MSASTLSLVAKRGDYRSAGIFSGSVELPPVVGGSSADPGGSQEGPSRSWEVPRGAL